MVDFIEKSLSIVFLISFLSRNFARKYIFSTSFPLLFPNLKLISILILEFQIFFQQT